MLTDREKLLKTFDVFETTIKEIEDIGEYRNYDLDCEIDSIYDDLQFLSMRVHSLLCERGWNEEI